MFIYPNAKINIGLNIISKTSDGYHNIESCFCPIDLHDIIELKISNKTSLSTSGIIIPGNSNNNLIIKSIKLFNPKLNFKIHLHKNIPIGSGLGGGSSNATFLLKYLNNNNKYSNDEIMNISKKIGSDCPFFLENKSKYITGKGEKMENINIDLNDKKLIIIIPKKSISTIEAYDNIKPKKSHFKLKEILENESLENWKNYVKNDFETYTFSKINELKKIKNHLYDLGATFVSLTGSGSAIYGIFNNTKNIIINNKYRSIKSKIIGSNVSNQKILIHSPYHLIILSFYLYL